MLRHCAYMVTFVPSMLRCSVAEIKPGARLTKPSVARVRRSISRCWLASVTVNTLMNVTVLSFPDAIVTSTSLIQRLSLFILDFKFLFDGCGQFLVVGIDNEDREQLCRLGLARIAADGMAGAGWFGPALARLVDPRCAVVHLRLDPSGNDVGVDEGRFCVGVRNRGP